MDDDDAEDPLAALLESWALQMEVAETSRNTILLYVRGVNAYREWCAATGTEPTFGKTHVERFIVACKDDYGRSVSTRKAYLKGIRRFVQWAVGEDELAADEVSAIPSPSMGKTLPPSISLEDHAAILATCDPKTLIGKRDAALLMMLLTSGCRASELIGLQLADVTVRTRRALVHGKGRQDRMVAYTSETALALDRYIRARRLHRAASSTTALWLSQRGTPLTYWGLDNMVERRAQMAGVEGVHAHQWRHLWARTFLRDSGNRDALKLLGGWKSDEMVEHYTQVDAAERALEVYDRVYGTR